MGDNDNTATVSAALPDDVETTGAPASDSISPAGAGAAPSPDPNAAPDTQSVLSGAPASPAPPIGGPTNIPGFQGNVNGMTGQAQQPVSKWDRVIAGALMGLAGSAGARNFAQGVAGGVKGVLAGSQEAKQNDIQQQKLAVEQQNSMDSHQLAQSQLATAHIEQQRLQAQYDLMPKTSQDILDQISMKQGADADAAGAKTVFTGSYTDALARQQAEMTQNSQSPLSVRTFKNPDGTFSVKDIPNPEKLNDKPVDVVIGYDFDKKTPITKRYSPGTISYAQQTNMETNAATNSTQANNGLELHQKTSDIDVAAKKTEAQQSGEYAKNMANANKDNAEAAAARGDQNMTDPFGTTITPPQGGTKEYNKRVDAFKKNADNLSQTEQTYKQFSSVLGDINAGKDITGAQSVVGLFNAIGISAEPLKGKGFRINNNTVQEHVNARGLGQQAYNFFANLKNGEIITPQQIKDYANIAMDSRKNAYVTNYNQAKAAGVNPDFLLPHGNGQKIDPSTASIFMELGGNDPKKAQAAAQTSGWTF